MNLSERDLKHIWHPCSQMKDYETFLPIVIQRAEGLYLYDEEGKAYMDVISSWWCNLLGHRHPHINDCIKGQLDRLAHVIFANFTHEPAILLCERLMPYLPQGLNKFFFTDNGSAAIEAALKMSFQYHKQTGKPEKKRFMALTGAYHGETVGALSVSGLDLYGGVFEEMLLDVIRVQGPECYRCPFGMTKESCQAECFCEAEAALFKYGNETAGFIIEPMLQAAYGMKMYSEKYLQKLRKACDAFGVHLIADEIATGYGRTGKMFAVEHAGIAPDIMCLSKGLTGGYLPMALAVTTDEMYEAFYDDYHTGKGFMHSHTYCGNPLACSAALGVLDVFEKEHILEGLKEKKETFEGILQARFATHPNVAEIRGIGLIYAIQLVQDKKSKAPFEKGLRVGYRIYQEAIKKGILLRPLGDVLYFNPPLTITETQMQIAVDKSFEAMSSICLNLGS